jgi:flavin-dependent thymidylate synthase
MTEPQWLKDYRDGRTYGMWDWPQLSRSTADGDASGILVADRGFNSHALNDGRHVSPYDNATAHVGTDGIIVNLVQGINEESFTNVLSRALRATTGIPLSETEPPSAEDREEMLKGGLQSALETQVLVFEVFGASRAVTHQLVRSRKAGFHQQSQRATWYGDRPDVRVPASILNAPKDVRVKWLEAIAYAWEAYSMACEAGVSYQDARYILPEGTVNYIQCEYTVREFMNVFAYRGCSMFLWEMVWIQREMRRLLLEAHPFMELHVKISCEKTGSACDLCYGSGWVHMYDNVAADSKEIEAWTSDSSSAPYPLKHCPSCDGRGGHGRKCTFQGWESVEGVCSFPWARQDNRVFLPNPKNRIGG